MLLIRRLVNNGNSSAITLPAQLVRERKYHLGDTFLLSVRGDELVLRRIVEADVEATLHRGDGAGRARRKGR
jgi:antitoxin component of MazEF toxin-antitoxin module